MEVIQLPERFELLEEIGSGGMGTVWKARDTETGEVVALKIVHPHLAKDADYIARFEREVEVARRIESPYVVKVFGYGTREGVPYMAMEYVEGHSLRDRLRSGGAMTWEEAKPIVRQVAEGLGAAHDAGVIHRDVKPSNILMTKDGTAKLADFGIARALDLTRLTGSSTMLGTPHYMAPEGTASPQSDLYALGCVLFEMLTGHPPFEGESQQAVLLAHVRDAPRTSELSGEARRLEEWLLAKHPGDRPRTASDVIRALDGRPLLRASAGHHAPRWPLAMAGAVGAVVLLGFAVGLLRFGPDASSADEVSATTPVRDGGITSTAEKVATTLGSDTTSPTDTVVPPVTSQSPVGGGVATTTPSNPTATPAPEPSPAATSTIAPARLTSISFVSQVQVAVCGSGPAYQFFVPGASKLPELGDSNGAPTARSGVLIDELPLRSGVFRGGNWGGSDTINICIDATAPDGIHTITVYFENDRVSTTFQHVRTARLTSINFVARLPTGTACPSLAYRFDVPGLAKLPALGDGQGNATAAGGVLIDGLPMGSGMFRGFSRDAASEQLTICIDPNTPDGIHTVTVYFDTDRVSTSFEHTR